MKVELPELSVSFDPPSTRQSSAFLNLEEGTVISDRYIVQRLLGRGSSGSVYACTDNLISGLTVAVKLFPRTDNNDLRLSRRIYREMLTCNNINHPNVTKFYDCIHSEEFIGYSMEYVDGRSIGSFIESEQPADIGLILRLFKQVILGLHAIHSIGVVHRDIKPSNILCTSGGYIKISDFGVATQRTKNLQIIEGLPSFYADMKDRPSDTYTYTEQGRFVGTPRYLSPEYIEHGYTDFRSDLYAAGVILYELVTGKYPFPHNNLPELLQRKVEDVPAPPCEFRTDLPSGLNKFILSLISTDPNDRFVSAMETLDALNSLETSLGKADNLMHSRSYSSGFLKELRQPEGQQSEDQSDPDNRPDRIRVSTVLMVVLLCFLGCVFSLYFVQSALAQDIKYEFGKFMIGSLQSLWYLMA